MKREDSSNTSQTDIDRLHAMGEQDIDLSDIPEVSVEMFAKAVVKRGLSTQRKAQLTLRIDADVLEWFKSQGRGYQTRINALLRAYMEEAKTQAVLHESRTKYDTNS